MIRTTGLRIGLAALSALTALPAITQAAETDAARSAINLGVLQYAGGDFAAAARTFAAIKGAEALLWQARSRLQLQEYDIAARLASAARDAGLATDQEEIARRVQIAAIRLGGLQSAYPQLAKSLEIKQPKSFNISLHAGVDFVTGLLREFDNNNNAVRKNDVQFTVGAAASYRLPWRPGGFQPTIGYGITQRIFADNNDFNQQTHRPFIGVTRRIADKGTVSVNLNHVTSLTGSDFDLFVRQFGGGVNTAWKISDNQVVRAGWSLAYSDFNGVEDDDNFTNSLIGAWTRQDAGNPANKTTFGARAALVSAEAQSSAHTIISAFASREMAITEKWTLSGQLIGSFARFNDDDPVENERRRDKSVSGSVGINRDLGNGFSLSGNASLTRVFSNIERVDRTNAIVGAQIRKRF